MSKETISVTHNGLTIMGGSVKGLILGIKNYLKTDWVARLGYTEGMAMKRNLLKCLDMARKM